MRYAFVENNVIVKGPTSVPKSWKNITGFHLMSDAELKLHGWLPWNFIEISVDSDEVYGQSIIEITADAVVETQTKRKKTADELAEESRQKAENVREKRNGLLANSDWTQLSDAPLTTEQKTAWTLYRQVLRDIPQQDGFPNAVSFPAAPRG